MTITQLAPFNGTVIAGISDDYVVQLEVSGNTSAPTFFADSGSSNLFIDSDGTIVTTGILQPGSYNTSGIVVDGSGNQGTWSFTLLVTGSLTPQTVITPTSLTPGTGVEILFPFQVDPATGGIAQTSEYLQIYEQHIISIVMTAVNERVMMANYGCSLEDLQFINTTDVLLATKADDIKSAIHQWEPAVTVDDVQIYSLPNNPSTLYVTVTFSVDSFVDTDQITVSVGGQNQQVTSP